MPRPFPHESESYPFTATSSFAVEEDLHFPRGILLDAHVYAREAGAYGITRIWKRGGKFQLMVGTESGGDLAAAYGEFGTGLRQLDLFDEYRRRAGVLLVGNLDLFLGFPDGEYSVPGGALRFETACHVPVRAGDVEGFVIEREVDYESSSAGAEDAVLRTFVSGDVTLIGSQGVVLELDQDTEPPELVVHFVGEPYGRRWQGVTDGLPLHDKWTTSIRLEVRSTLGAEYSTVKQLFPDENGNISLYMYNMIPLERDALRILGEEDKLTFKLAGK